MTEKQKSRAAHTTRLNPIGQTKGTDARRVAEPPTDVTILFPGRCTREAANLSGAQAVYVAERDASGEGVTDFPSARIYRQGLLVARINYLGEVLALDGRRILYAVAPPASTVSLYE